MKKSIFLFFAAILCATSAWGSTKFVAGDVLFYDFTDVPNNGGVNWAYSAGNLVYDPIGAGTVKCLVFTNTQTWSSSTLIAKTQYGSWSEIKFTTDRPAGCNCIKFNENGKGYTWTTRSIEEAVLSGNYIMVYGGELTSWSQDKFLFMATNSTDDTKAVASIKQTIKINSENYYFGPALVAPGTYYMGHWNSGLKYSIEAGSAYVVRNSGASTTYFTKKAEGGGNCLYQVKKQSSTPTTTLTPTYSATIMEGEKLPFTPGDAGVSVVGKTNTIKYYLKNGSTYTEKTLTDNTIDVSDLPAGNYSIETLLYDGYIYVKASTSNFTIESAYDVTFANDGNGTTNQTGTIKVGAITGIAIDATPNTDYVFNTWQSSNGGTFDSPVATASNKFYPTENTTVTATFRSTAVNALLVVAGANIESVTGSKEPVTLGEAYNITATPLAGYAFEKWVAEPAENGVFADAASASTTVTVQNASVTVTASATEIMSALTTSNSYDTGTPSIAAPTATVSEIGITTTANITAAVGEGYTFTGWTLTNCVRTDAGADNATTITVKSNGDGTAAKVTAKYEQNVVYFVNTKGWEAVNVYAWDPANADWPGIVLTDEDVVKTIGGCKVYKYVSDKNRGNVIFGNNKNDQEKTADLTWQNGKYYVYNSENSIDPTDWYNESEVEGVLPTPVTLTYNVTVPAGTKACYIAGDMNGWALTAMEKIDDTHYSLEIQWATNAHKYKYASGPEWKYEEVKADGTSVDNRTYSANDVVAKWKEVYDPTVIPDRYLTGNDAVFGYNDGWTNNQIKMTWDEGNSIYTYTTPTLSANKNYIFRVTDENWGKWGYDKLDPVPANVLSFGDDKNICFMLAAEGTITVTLDGDQLSLTTSSSFAAPVYTIVGDEALAGHHWDLNASDNQMTLESENIYKLVKTITIPAGTYEYKAVRNHSYEWQVPAEGDNSINIEKSGTGTITYTLDISKPELTAAISDWVEQDLSTKVTLKGIGEDKDFTEAADGKTTSVSVTLEANQVYEFDIVVNSVYMKNNGTMWRENCTGWTFSQDANSAHIITDLAGTYTFTWTYEGNKLSVTYPTGTNVPKPVFLAGGMNNWDRLATRLIPSADGKTASVTIELNRNDAKEFRIVLGTDDLSNTGQMTRDNCTGWTFKQLTGDDASKNASILPDATGEYTFTWTYGDDKQLSVTYPEACTDCSGYYLVGSMNDWKQTADEFMKAEGTTVEISKELAAGSYEFKIKNGDDWYSDQDLTVTRSKSTSIAFDMKEGGNTHFTADIDGVYTFTYTTDQKKLTVTYPEIIIGDGDNSSVLNSLNGKTVDLKVTRSFASGTLYTLVLPFAMDNNTVKSIFGTNVELYDFTSLSENTSGELILSFTKQETPAIVAGTPYLIKPAANANGFDLSDVTINKTTTTVVKTCGPTTITMQPVLSAAAEDKTNGTSQYWLAANNNLYNNAVSIKGLRVIFDVQTTKANVRARAAFNENVETGVEDLFTTDTPVKAIVNGQLIIIRDGVKYNVQGQKL